MSDRISNGNNRVHETQSIYWVESDWKVNGLNARQQWTQMYNNGISGIEAIK